MLPWVAERPLTLVRCPQGRAKKCFFQKHDAGTFGPHVHHVPIEEKKGEVRGLSLHRRPGGAARLRPDGGDRVPRLGRPDRGLSRSPTGSSSTSIPTRGSASTWSRRRRATSSAPRRHGPAELPAADRRQGAPRRRSADPRRNGRRSRISRCASPSPWRPPSRTGSPPTSPRRRGGPDVPRLSAQPARRDRDHALFDPGPRPGAPVAAPIAWDELDDYETSLNHPAAPTSPCATRTSARSNCSSRTRLARRAAPCRAGARRARRCPGPQPDVIGLLGRRRHSGAAAETIGRFGSTRQPRRLWRIAWDRRYWGA
jgi:bifunctional non-homologous end joining protein LigD